MASKEDSMRLKGEVPWVAARPITDIKAMSRLQHLGHLCSQAKVDFAHCLAEILDTAIALTSADKGNVQLLEKDTGTLRIAAQRGFDQPFLDFFDVVHPEHPSACGASMQLAHRVTVSDVTQSQLFAEKTSSRILVDAGVRAVQSTPLISGQGSILGMVSTHFKAPREFTDRDFRFLDLLARQAADFIERRKADDELCATLAALEAKAKELETLIDILPAGVLIADPACDRIRGNRAFYKMIGLPYGSNASVPSLTSDMPRGTRVFRDGRELSPHEFPMQAAGLTAQRISDFDHDVVFPDGRRVTLLANTAPLLDDQGRVRGVVGAYIDITDRKRAENERESLLASERAARTEAQRANQSKDEFLSMVSHELRTPLSAILGWAHLLRGDDGAKDLEKGLETIERNARVQAEIIEDLLDLSRILSGKVRLDMQSLEVTPLILAAIDTIKLAAAAKDIRVGAELDPSIGRVKGDPNRLQQIIWNLLSNAVKFTPRNGRVQINVNRNGSLVEISVTDTGQGIRSELLPHLFDRYRRADTSTARRQGGLGIGLSIVKSLVELHGGSVAASSPGEGCGSTFVVRLPEMSFEVPEESPGSRPRTARSFSLDSDLQKLRGLKVLVVDDEPDALQVLQAILEECEAEVTPVLSAREALNSLRRNKPDVMVSDIGMPELDGYELIRRVRSLPAEQGGGVPAVALTAYARSEDRTRALNAGYLMHLGKPVEPAELVASIAALARRTP